ncbi:MAG TPA: sialidase family protein, partial [Kofleriaceae bacterium]
MRPSAACIAVLCPVLALAQGRAPLTSGVHFRPGDPRSIYVATTFGLLISRDDGCSFRWVCPQNIDGAGALDPSYGSSSRPSYRPKYRIARDGTIFATTFRGLRVSRDGGCSFTTATSGAPAGDPGRIADAWIDAIDLAPTGDLWVTTADSGKPNDVYRSTDNAETFRSAGLLSPSIWWKSVVVAPSRARRIYATGYQVAGTLGGGGQRPPTAHLEVSDDTGTRWQESPLTGVAFGAVPEVLVLGVDPGDPDIVFLSSVLASAPGDRLYRSSDGGRTWTDVLDTVSPIVDLAALPDGGVLVATRGAGAFRSTDHGASFQPMVGAPPLACIGQRGDGAVFGCGATGEPDFQAVARSQGGRTWNEVFRF